MVNSRAKTFLVGVGGMIRVTDSITNTRGSSAITVSGGVLWANRLNGRGSIGNSKTGNGTLWITGSSAAIGPTFWLDAGTFIFGNSFALGSGGLVDLGGDLVLAYVIVPEPEALALAACGLAAAWGYRRRRRAHTRVR
jgi:MYXO-CTERM domain-containing protein